VARAGQPILALDFTDTETDAQGTSGTTTSTSYTETFTGGTACSLTFMAPTSGKVRVTLVSRITNSGANESYVSFIMREGAVVGSGDTVVDAQDDRAVFHSGTTFARQQVDYLAEGLTPGATYNVRQACRVTAGTGSFANKELIVSPEP
jgi:hypothetical protein